MGTKVFPEKLYKAKYKNNVSLEIWLRENKQTK